MAVLSPVEFHSIRHLIRVATPFEFVSLSDRQLFVYAEIILLRAPGVVLYRRVSYS